MTKNSDFGYYWLVTTKCYYTRIQGRRHVFTSGGDEILEAPPVADPGGAQPPPRPNGNKKSLLKMQK